MTQFSEEDKERLEVAFLEIQYAQAQLRAAQGVFAQLDIELRRKYHLKAADRYAQGTWEILPPKGVATTPLETPP
jgi:hypothetical protein